MPDADEHRLRAMGAVLDIVACVFMSDQRRAAARAAWPAMANTAHALAGLADEMARLLDASDEHAQYAGHIQHPIRAASWAIHDDVERAASYAIRDEVERAGGLQ
jgi:hypothetical protein